jgi:hypothetical protein
MKTEDALAGDGRRTDKEARLPLPRNRNRLSLGRRGSQLDQNDGRGDRGDRHRGVHYDAKLAVVGISRIRVKVGNLGDCQSGKEHKAQASHYRKKIHPAGVLPAEKRLKCSQTCLDLILFYKKYAFCWTLVVVSGCPKVPFIGND